MAENIINNEELNKIGVKLNGALSDDELENVSGGFTETTPGLATQGMSIRCPKCGETSSAKFAPQAWQDKKMGSVEYHCGCGCKFVCYDGYSIMKGDWMSLCAKKGYSYPFAQA